jgi:hypothetical protein
MLMIIVLFSPSFKNASFVKLLQLCYLGLQIAKRKKKGKPIPVTGRSGLYGCETSRIPHFLDIRLTDGDKIAILKRLPRFTTNPRKIPGTHFCYRLSQPPRP